jgi:hypothetical protein
MRLRRSNVTLAALRIQEMHMKDTRKPARKPAAAKPAAKSAAKREVKPAVKPAAKSAAKREAMPADKGVARSAAKPAAKPAPAKAEVVRKKTAAVLAPATSPRPGDNRAERIRVAAFLRAERRGFAPGYEWDDWLAAEAEVNAVTGPPGDE